MRVRVNLADVRENMDMAGIDGTRGVEVRRVYARGQTRALCYRCWLRDAPDVRYSLWTGAAIVHTQTPGEVPCCENVIRGWCLSENTPDANAGREANG